MKRIVALALLSVMLVLSLCACGVDMEDKGAIIPVYLAPEFANLDPSRTGYDKDLVKYTGLLYESLTEMTDSGKLRPALAKEWEERYNEERGEYFLTIKLVSTKWNDGRAFTADQVVYAWKRALSPESDSAAASLLFDIKNARDVKAGKLTVDDLGVATIDTYTLEVEFEKPIDSELFLEAVSSPALVPLRDDAIVNKEDTWATNVDDLSTVGKFSIKSMVPGGLYRLDFSKYYKLTKEAEAKKGYNEYVKPYKLLNDYARTPAQALEAYRNGEVYYVGVLSKADYEANKGDVKTSDTLSTYTYFFNCTNKALSKASVRKALSLALDRNEIANLIGLGTKASEGFVSSSATGSSLTKKFRKDAGAVYSASAKVEEAKSLLGGANGSFSITYREDREWDKPVAEYAKGVWEKLGFTVSLTGLSGEEYEKAIAEGNFDCVAVDFNGLSTNAYSFLSVFARGFSGAPEDIESDEKALHVTGYASEKYDELLNSVLEETDRGARNKILVEAEKLLAEECPAIALVEYENYYLASSDLKGLETSPYGYTLFTNATVKNYAENNKKFEE